MKCYCCLLVWGFVVVLVACASPAAQPTPTSVAIASVIPTATPIPKQPASPTVIQLAAATSLLSTISISPSAMPANAQTVNFMTSDGIELHGILYGSGSSTIILSNMGDNDPEAWQTFAPQMVALGYSVLTYSYRYPKNTSHFDNLIARQTLDDMQAAIGFVQSRSAQHIVLVGASLGGMVSARAAAETQPNALVVIGAPVDLPAFDFRVEPDELQKLIMPKLLIGSEQDRNVPFSETQRMYDLVPEPKELLSYPSTAHGVQLFKSSYGDSVGQRILDFISKTVPPASASSSVPLQDEASQRAWLQYLSATHPSHQPFYRTSEAHSTQAVQQLDRPSHTIHAMKLSLG